MPTTYCGYGHVDGYHRVLTSCCVRQVRIPCGLLEQTSLFTVLAELLVAEAKPMFTIKSEARRISHAANFLGGLGKSFKLGNPVDIVLHQ